MTDAPKNDPLLPMVTEIVVAYLSHNTVAMTEIPRLIAETRQALERSAGALNGAAKGVPANGQQKTAEPAIAIRKSVTPDYLICLEDGTRLKMLKRHLRTAYNLSPEQYRQKWGLPADYPMVAPNYAKKRSSLARAFGLGRADGKRMAGKPLGGKSLAGKAAGGKAVGGKAKAAAKGAVRKRRPAGRA